MPNKPIPVKDATAMMKAYVSYMTGLGVDMTQQTQTVSFGSQDLSKYISDTLPYADEFRICFGQYLPGQENAGRLTTIIWPYKDGKPAVYPSIGDGEGLGDPGGPVYPYNEGNGRP